MIADVKQDRPVPISQNSKRRQSQFNSVVIAHHHSETAKITKVGNLVMVHMEPTDLNTGFNTID
jgi:hypothetical protein